MHICHISTTFNHQAGSARRTFKIVRHLVDQGYEVSLVVGRDFSPHEDWNLADVRVVHVKHLTKYVDLKRDILSLVKLVSLLRRMRPILVHTHLAKAGILGRFAARAAGVPIIIHTVHGPTFVDTMNLPKRAVYHFLERLASFCADRFVFVGNELAEHYINNRICTLEKSIVIHTGLFYMRSEIPTLTSGDISRIRQSLCNNAGCLTILTVGRIVPSKQQEHSIRALAGLVERGVNAELLIAGEALLPEERYYKAELEQLAKTLHLEKQVHFLGFRDDIRQLMMASDVLLLTSKYEGLPNVVVEAGLVGCPVITYDIMGVREVVSDDSLTVIPQGDLFALIDVLMTLTELSKTLRPICQDNRVQLKRFSVEEMLSSKLSLYESLLSSECE